jgi:hypothetical protein
VSAARPLRAAGLAAVGLLLLAALWGALARVGWRVPVGEGEVVAYHGVLMTLGALGTLIGLERAVASGWRWAFLGPAASALGALALIAGASVGLGRGLLLAGGALVALTLVRPAALQPALHGVVLAVGGALWVGGVLAWWAAGSIVRAVPWLAGFLVVTIAAERLELSRMRGLRPRARAAFVASLALLLAGLLLSVVAFPVGVRLAGVAFLALAAWLASHDVARRTVRQPGLTRFMALALLAGYAWLGVAGILWLVAGDRMGPARDAMLHALFLGFVISMVFAHAPVILPAVLGLEVVWAPSAYVPLGLLHVSLLSRVVADLGGAAGALRWTGLANVTAIVLFLLDTASTRLRTRRDTHV